MELSEDFFREVLADFFSRCEQHRLVGIPYKDFIEGRIVPEGWHLDYHTMYFLPPNYVSHETGGLNA